MLLALTLFGREHGGNLGCGLLVQLLDQPSTLILAQRRIVQDGDQLLPFREKDRADLLFLLVAEVHLRVYAAQMRVGEEVRIAHDVVRRGSGLRSGLGDGKASHQGYENEKFPHQTSKMKTEGTWRPLRHSILAGFRQQYALLAVNSLSGSHALQTADSGCTGVRAGFGRAAAV